MANIMERRRRADQAVDVRPPAWALVDSATIPSAEGPRGCLRLAAAKLTRGSALSGTCAGAWAPSFSRFSLGNRRLRHSRRVVVVVVVLSWCEKGPDGKVRAGQAKSPCSLSFRIAVEK